MLKLIDGQTYTIRYIAQNPQMIPYPNPNDLQNQQPVYCPNGQIIYNMPPNQPQLTQSGVELGYAPSATTPTRVVNQSASHTPSPLSQQQQGHQSMPPPPPLQQGNQQNVINHVQQYPPQQQNYGQSALYYFASNLPQHMQPGQITYALPPGKLNISIKIVVFFFFLLELIYF